MKTTSTALVAFALLASGCYHAIVTTGRPEGKVINRPFQPSFIAGLVPPPPLNVASECPSGIAKVETQHSFIEGLVAGITFGIFTPMTITVTCASGSAALPAAHTVNVAAKADDAARSAAIGRAAEIAIESGDAAFVRTR